MAYGFSIQSPDLWWTPYVWTIPDPTAAPVLEYREIPELYSTQISAEDIPAFSLTTLMQALPGSVITNGSTYSLHITKDRDVYTVGYYNETSILAYRDGIDLIDIAVQMIIFLLKSNIPLDSAYIYNNTI